MEVMGEVVTPLPLARHSGSPPPGDYLRLGFGPGLAPLPFLRLSLLPPGFGDVVEWSVPLRPFFPAILGLLPCASHELHDHDDQQHDQAGQDDCPL